MSNEDILFLEKLVYFFASLFAVVGDDLKCGNCARADFFLENLAEFAEISLDEIKRGFFFGCREHGNKKRCAVSSFGQNCASDGDERLAIAFALKKHRGFSGNGLR